MVIAVGRVSARSDVVHQIVAYDSITGLIDSRVRRGALKADDVDSDVVVVVDDVVCDAEVGHVSVHHQRFARTGLEVVDHVAVNYQLTDGSGGVGAVYGDAEPVTASPWSITALKILFNVMDVVMEQFYMRAGAHNADPQGSEPMFRGAVVANFKSLDSHVTLVVNGKHTASSLGNQMHGV